LNANSPFAPDVRVRRRKPSTDVKLMFASGTAAPLVSTTTPETLASPSAEDVGVCKAGVAAGMGTPFCRAAIRGPHINNAEYNQRVAYNFVKFPPNLGRFRPIV